jgi:predicted O-linked N-acetylglucosamine transferase (SPINDLY family)
MEAPSADPAGAAQSSVAAAFRQAVTLHAQGNAVQSEALCGEVLGADPKHAGAWHLLGLLALARGDADQGIDRIERSLRIDPHQPAAHLNVGNSLLNQNQPELALLRFDRALALKADYPLALYNRGNALRALGRFEAALASYEAASRLHAGDWRLENNRGLMLLELSRADEALAAFERAVHLEPPAVEARKNLAVALARTGRAQAALNAYEQLCLAAPEDADVWCGRGNVLMALKRPEDAAANYSRALQCKPDCAEALINRCAALLALRRPAESLLDAEAATRLAPRSRLAFNNAANALLELGRLEEALAHLEAAQQLEPAATDTIYNRGVVLRRLRRFGESANCFEDLLRFSPDREYALGYLFQLRMDACDWTDYESLTRRIITALAGRKRVINPMTLLLLDLPAEQRACAQSFAADQWPEESSLGPCAALKSLDAAAASPAAPAAIDATRKLRVAYVSADFREHPVSYLLVGVLERHDRAHVEVIGVSLAPVEDGPFGRRVRRAFDHYIEAANRTDREIALLLRELRVDIAVDLMGYTEGMRLGIFAHRTAPVQVGYLGYAGTLGVPYVDYLLADAVVIPPGLESTVTEAIVRLPDCYLPNDDRREMAAPATRSRAGLPAGAFVFCAFTNACKLNPPVFAVWLRLLREVPGSVLWLSSMGAEARDHLQREAGRCAIDPGRLVFAPRVAGIAEHLARLSCADLFLDTLPYNAHSTACDALWAGVPVITCAGQSFASRVAASALTAVGLAGLITRNLAQYELQALELARHPEQLQVLRAKLAANRATAPLFDTVRYIHHLETAYRTMHERAVQGMPPCGFSVSSRTVA